MIGTRMKTLRMDSGLSQAALGNKLGVTQQTIGKWENENAEPGCAAISALCRLFGVTSDYLLGLSDNRQPKNAAAGKQLGLSDGAIESLESLKYLESNRAILNALLSDPELPGLLDTIAMLRAAASPADEQPHAPEALARIAQLTPELEQCGDRYVLSGREYQDFLSQSAGNQFAALVQRLAQPDE